MKESVSTVSEKIKTLPEAPGVYLMKDMIGKIIYVGKAKNLRKRLASYFSRQPVILWKTSRLVSKIADVDFMITDNEEEAILLESNLIKRYRPLFNIELKDQQRYTYLKITNESFPRLVVARRNRNGDFYGPKGQLYGPFVHGSSKYLTIGLLRKLFKIRICKKLPKAPCLEYFIKNCDAPCIKNITQADYMKNVYELQSILSGKSNIDNFVSDMRAQMRYASETQQYEKAKEMRDTLQRLENLRMKQKVESLLNRRHEEEYVGIKQDLKNGTAHVMMLRRSQGVISDRKLFQFELIGDNSLETFLIQYYSTLAVIPKFIYVNEEIASKAILESSLRNLSGHAVNIVKIRSDFQNRDKKEIMDLILRNIDHYIKMGYDPAIIDLKTALDLTNVPLIMDCFDVSNFASSFAVGACTRFINAKPDKSGYRKFKIKLTTSQNDVAMIAEIVSRRYSSMVNSVEEESKMPDLIVIDGGKGQLHAAIEAISNLGLDIPCIALAKEDEDIYLPGSEQPINLAKSSAGLKALQHIRDEAHRFGLAYNIKLRNRI